MLESDRSISSDELRSCHQLSGSGILPSRQSYQVVQGEPYQADLRVIRLDGSSTILGIDWLRSSEGMERANYQPELCGKSRLSQGLNDKVIGYAGVYMTSGRLCQSQDDKASETSLTSPGDLGLCD
uniref:Uncharacterized protein n=1 Tax=Ananas comosus var. bracteatus TaxID=296719 RepID=A0A6V7P4K9_ANACO|nr:unnamed protein product [Ananas comosus var. bracteatus]